jgi:hypothetical protein
MGMGASLWYAQSIEQSIEKFEYSKVKKKIENIDDIERLKKSLILFLEAKNQSEITEIKLMDALANMFLSFIIISALSMFYILKDKRESTSKTNSETQESNTTA